MTPAEVFEHHGQAVDAGDVEEILRDYAEDSVLLTPEGVFRGPRAMRPVFERLVTELLPPGESRFEMEQMAIEGDLVYIVWNSSSPRAEVSLGTDTFVVREGKIVAQTWTARIVSKTPRATR
jgi:ketosteroid isomerase-like protein